MSPIHVFSPEMQAEAWVPERVFDRMQAVAVGYGLHVIPLLAEDALRFLDGSQAATFSDEVAFIAHEQMAIALQGALLVRHGHPAVADAFCASRLDGGRGQAYGTLPTGVDTAAILARATPKVP